MGMSSDWPFLSMLKVMVSFGWTLQPRGSACQPKWPSESVKMECDPRKRHSVQVSDQLNVLAHVSDMAHT